MGLGILITVDNKVDQELTGLVTFVEVQEKIDLAVGYKIRFAIDVCSNDIGTLWEKKTDPGSVLGVFVETKDTLECLVNGPVTNQEINLEHGGSGSWLEVVGTDDSHQLDLDTKERPHKGTDAEIVDSILPPKFNAKVTDTPSSSHEEDKHQVVQKESDFAFIRRLAQRNGFHFWITYDSKGVPTTYFKTRTLDGTASAKLKVNVDDANVDNLQFKWDIKPPVKSKGKQINQNTKEVFDGETTLNKSEQLNTESLGKIAGKVASSMQLAPPVDSAGELSERGKAALRDAQWFINGSCKTTSNRICKIIRSHTVVDVEGAGTRFSGKYYVVGVKHYIDSALHSMDIELSSNAWNTKDTISSLLKPKF